MNLIDSILNPLGYHRAKNGYQDGRFPEDQYELITRTNEYQDAQNTLEIGCNQGKLVSLFSNDQKFAVGLDISQHWAHTDTGNAVLGVKPLSSENVDQLPAFDVIFLLSVHHQWVESDSNEGAQQLIHKLIGKATSAFYIEFAAIASKYGYEQNQYFKDNDEDTVREYAENWLGQIVSSERIEFLGKTREKAPIEPFRYLYKIGP